MASPADVSGFLAGVPPELLGQVLRTGGGKARRDALTAQVQRGQAMQQQGGQRYSNPWAAALGGLAGVAGAGIGAYEQRKGQEGLAALEEEQRGGREALLGAYTGGMQRTQATAPDVIAPNIGMPDATPDQQALAAALRGQQQEGREEGVRRGTAYLGLLSGDEGLQDFSKALMGEGATDLRAQSLEQGAERLRQQAAQHQQNKDLAERRFSYQQEQDTTEREAYGARAAEKRVMATLDREEGLRKEISGNPVGKDFMMSDVAYRALEATAKSPTAAGDLSMIFGFMKVLDPTSVVKEGEQEQVRNTTNIPGRYLNLLEKAQSGQQLSAAQRTELLQVARQTLDAKRAVYGRVLDGYKGIAERAKVDWRNVNPLGTPGAAPTTAPVPPASPGTGNQSPEPAGTGGTTAPSPTGKRVKMPDGTAYDVMSDGSTRKVQ